MSNDLQDLIRQAAAKVAAMTPAEKQAMLAEQRQSWVRGELGMLNQKGEQGEQR